MKVWNKTMVYDWPTRIFHGLFALLFVVAYVIAETVSDESSFFTIHIMAGLTIGFILILRIGWGFFGTTFARFSSFKLNPVELLQYLKDVVVSKTKSYLGHNPGSSYAAVVMFVCAVGLVTTGVMMTGGSKSDFYEETHELLANVFLIAVVAHIGVIIFHHVRHRDSLWSSMFDGKKEAIPGKVGITNSKRWAAILFIILTLTWIGYLYSTYDSVNQTIDVFGQELRAGEEHEEHEPAYEGDSYEEEYDDD
jgi:cytochrome b